MDAPQKEKYNFALYIPVIKENHWDVNDEGRVTLHLTVKDPVRRFTGWLVKRSPKTELDLDELSSKVWCLIDGKRTIYDISKEMAKDSATPDDELRRLVTFIRYCSKKGWVGYKANLNEE